MKNLILIALLIGLFMPLHTQAEVVVIVNLSNSDALDTAQIKKIFLGKLKRFPSGAQTVPITQKSSSDSRTEFDKKLLKKSASQLKAYWSKLLFTGKGQPPKEVLNDKEMIELVATNPNMIGYIDATMVNDTVKVIAKL
jgi:ABC-type phosphate transport system substrate-binding protein